MKKFFSLKFILSFVCVLAFRLIKGSRLPNLELVNGTMMPFAKEGGAAAGFAFTVFSVVVFDIVSGTAGAWTAVTALTYGAIGACAGLWFKNRQFTRMQAAGFAAVSTVAYDLITGVIATPLMYPMSFEQALIGQIPFTALHLLGNICCAMVFSPLLYKLLTEHPWFADCKKDAVLA